jgi:hypothetical protein
MKKNVGEEPSIQEQLDALDRRWNELVYGPLPPPKPVVPDVLLVPVSPWFAAMVKARPQTVKVRLAAEDDDGVTRIEWPTGPVTLDRGEAKPDFATSLTKAIQRRGDGNDRK